jgi:hypothetical protein
VKRKLDSGDLPGAKNKRRSAHSEAILITSKSKSPVLEAVDLNSPRGLDTLGMHSEISLSPPESSSLKVSMTKTVARQTSPPKTPTAMLTEQMSSAAVLTEQMPSAAAEGDGTEDMFADWSQDVEEAFAELNADFTGEKKYK